MNWFERKIRRYEHRRWTTDDNRRVQPFHWGLEHIGGLPDHPDPRAFVRQYSQDAIATSHDWFATTPTPAPASANIPKMPWRPATTGSPPPPPPTTASILKTS